MPRVRVNLVHYQDLELKDFAEKDEIRKAYKKMALKHHPDRGGSHEAMQRVNHAYEILSKFKNQYDRILRIHKYKTEVPQAPKIVIDVSQYGFYGDSGTTFTWHSYGPGWSSSND